MTKYGRLTVVRTYVKQGKGKSRKYATCKCDCGGAKEVRFDSLLSGQIQSCGCIKAEAVRKVDIKSGDKFGKLTIVREADPQRKGNARIRRFDCMCMCGRETTVLMRSLRCGATKSCGCGVAEQAKINVVNAHLAATKHGLESHPLYLVFRHMHSRCYNRKDKSYSDYGGRGITVCADWHGDKGLKDFVTWAISLPAIKRWRAGREIDRKNNHKGYNPANCWFTNKIAQGRNKRNNLWCDPAGLPDEEYELLRPYMRKSSKDVWQFPFIDLWEIRGCVSYNTAVSRLHRGWYPMEAVQTALICT